MKVAVIAHGEIPAQTANSIQLMKMAQAFAKLGHKVIVFVPGEDPGLLWETLARHYGLSQRFELHWLTSLPWLRRYDFARSAVAAAQAWQADLVHTRLPQAATLASWRGLPTIFELHDRPSGIMGPVLMRLFISGRAARRAVVNTQHLANVIRQRYRRASSDDMLLLAPNGVDLQMYANLPEPAAARKKLKLKDAFTVGYTGHLYSGRGGQLILQLARVFPAMQFLLVGGRERDIVRIKEEAVGLDNVTFVGFVPNAELPLYQSACDAFLMPYGTRVSGSSGADIAAFTNPLKIFEYLACGRPILASDLPVIREVLSNENAILLPAGDIQAWAEALRSIHKSPQRRAALARAGRKTAAQHTWEQRAQRILNSV